ncbi:hypothetical protein Hanom_Chr13g01240241 [Helianthus anomalus]
MRCKKHNNDLNSINDVCASFFCERLYKLILTRKQAEAHRSDQGFYNSPQIAVTSGGCIGDATATSSNNKKKKKSLIRFSSFSNLFRSNGHDGDSDSIHGASFSTSDEPSGAAGKPTSVTSSPLWSSNVRPVSDRRQKKLSAIWENMCLC